MNLLTLLILLLTGFAAWRGYTRGFGRVVVPSAGFIIGLLAGAWVAPIIGAQIVSSGERFMATLAISFVLAFVGAIIGEWAGQRFEGLTRRLHIGVLNQVLGGFFQAAFILFITWLVSAAAVNVQTYGIGKQVQGSIVIRTMDRLLPTQPDLIARLEKIISPNGFPNVFVSGEPRRTYVEPGQRVDNVKIAAAEQSVVKILGYGCGGQVEGSGFVIAPGVVVTNAHVVAGVTRPNVVDSTDTYSATVVFFDFRNDVAVLKVKDLPDPALAVNDQPWPERSTGAIIGFPGNGGLTVSDATLIDETKALGRDIYNRQVVNRNIYELAASINPGNSGGPLIDQEGRVVGIVFAKAVTQDNIGYALVLRDLLPAINAAAQRTAAVGTGRCASE